MTTVEPKDLETQSPMAADQPQAPGKPRRRRTDDGPEILPCLEHFVTLVRKSKRPAFVLTLVERAGGIPLAEIEALVETAKGALSIPARKAFFQAVARLGVHEQHRIECAAERIVLLDDEYGVQAVQSLLDEEDERDAAALETPTDRYSRALHLFLLQEYPEAGAKREQRFDHAERLQAMHRQWKSESFSSHYLGPKGIEPRIDAAVEEQLRARIAELFPKVSPDQILIEQFTRRDLAHADRCGGKDAGAAPHRDRHVQRVHGPLQAGRRRRSRRARGACGHVGLFLVGAWEWLAGGLLRGQGVPSIAGHPLPRCRAGL